MALLFVFGLAGIAAGVVTGQILVRATKYAIKKLIAKKE